jgi:hypothetical protein
MSQRIAYRAPVVAHVSGEFWPDSYWSHYNPVGAIVQQITGQHRRRVVRRTLMRRKDDEREVLHDVISHDEAMADQLYPQTLSLLACDWPPAMKAGEFLPDYLPHEAELARIVFVDTLSDGTRPVFSVRARRTRVGARYRYRIVDERDTVFTLQRLSSVDVLTFAQLVGLIDTATSPLHRIDTLPLVEEMLFDLMVNEASEISAPYRIHVESCVYPQLEYYYTERLRYFANQASNRYVSAAKRRRKR